jgi:hypothetical protein
MKRWIIFSAVFLAFQAEAEIYKCRDAKGNITYQGTPCPNGMVGKIEPAPPVLEGNRQRAQERMDRIIEMSRQQDIAREQTRRQKEEQARQIAEQEERDRQQSEQAEQEEQARLEQEYRERHFLNLWPQRFPWQALQHDSHDSGNHERSTLKKRGRFSF